MKKTFAASTEPSFCCYYDFLTPERAVQEDLVINKHNLVKYKLFHLKDVRDRKILCTDFF